MTVRGYVVISIMSGARPNSWNAGNSCSAAGHIETPRRTSHGHAWPRRSCPAFQVSGKSLGDALERRMTTYREVVMAAIST